jgi:hypothetical protein
MRLVSGIEEKIAMLRSIADTLKVDPDDVIIRYPDTKTNVVHGSAYGEYLYASALPTRFTSLKISRGEAEPEAKRQCSFVTAKHCRWIEGSFVESEITCEGLDCTYVRPGGPECICSVLTEGCTRSCHKSLSHCKNSNQSLAVDCHGGCPEEQRCAGCFDHLQISKTDKQGEHCFLIRPCDTGRIDDWHFMLSKPDHSDDVIYDFLLGELNGVALFKKNDKHVSRYCASEYGSLASIGEIEDTCSMISPHKLRSYLENWWHDGVKSYEFDGLQQECSIKALVFASSLYESLGDATICIETIKRPLYEAKCAQWRSSYHQRHNFRAPPPVLAPAPATTFSRDYKDRHTLHPLSKSPSQPSSASPFFDKFEVLPHEWEPSSTNYPSELPSERFASSISEQHQQNPKHR